MHYSIRLLLPIPLFLLLVACGGGGGGGGGGTTPPDTSQSEATTYTLFNADNLAPGETITLNLTGSDNDGFTYTGSLSYADRGDVMFGGVSLHQIDSLLSLTDNTGAFLSALINIYSDPTTREPVTSVNTDTGVVSTPIVISTLPPTGRTGDFGQSTSWSASDGSTLTGSWRLEASTGGRGKLIFSITSRDAGGAILFTEEDAVFINAVGEILSMEIVLQFPSGYILNLTGS